MTWGRWGDTSSVVLAKGSGTQFRAKACAFVATLHAIQDLSFVGARQFLEESHKDSLRVLDIRV